MARKLSRVLIARIETIIDRAKQGGVLVVLFGGEVNSIANGTGNGSRRIKKFMETNQKDVIGFYEVTKDASESYVRESLKEDIVYFLDQDAAINA